MNLIDLLASRFLTKATLVYKKEIATQVFHLRLQSESFKTADYTPGYFLRVYCGMGKNVGLNEKVRSYSVWELSAERGTIDMAVYAHSDGPGSQWAKDIKEGDGIYFAWHKGKFTTDTSADNYVFIGDISALAHLYQIRRSLSQNKKIVSIIYAQHETDFFADNDEANRFDCYVMPENPGPALISNLNTLLKGLNGKSIVYIGGDSRVCVTLNSYFRKQLNWSSQQVKTKPFWNPEKKGLE